MTYEKLIKCFLLRLVLVYPINVFFICFNQVMVCHCKPPSDGGLGCGEECLNRMLNIECVQGTCPCGDFCSNQQVNLLFADSITFCLLAVDILYRKSTFSVQMPVCSSRSASMPTCSGIDMGRRVLD